MSATHNSPRRRDSLRRKPGGSKKMDPTIKLLEDTKAQYDNTRSCVNEIREVVDTIKDADLRDILLTKIANLEECFEGDKWNVENPKLALKVAVLGPPDAGQSELLLRFLCGNPDGHSAGHKNVLERLTGVKSTYSSVTNRHQATIPCNDEERPLLLHTAVGDAGPKVLTWADAFLIVFNSSDSNSFQAVQQVYTKILRYRRADDLPCIVVNVARNNHEDQGTTEHEVLKSQFATIDTKVHVTRADPSTGMGVDRLFHDLVHFIMESSGHPELRRVPSKLELTSSGSNTNVTTPTPVDRDTPIIQGPLKKHHAKGGAAERWVTLVAGNLVYFSSLSSYHSKSNGKTIPLLQVSVKVPMSLPASLRKKKDDYPHFSLSMQDPKTGHLKEWRFETKDTEETQKWSKAIQDEIAASLNRLQSRGIARKGHTLTPEEQSKLLAVQGNSVCADCSKPLPEWASLNLTVLLCIDCAGVHRNLGVHISQMRSLQLDDWRPEHYKTILGFGNLVANQVFEADVPQDRTKPTPDASRAEKEKYIIDKYQHKAFLGERHVDPPRLLSRVIEEGGTNVEKFGALVQCTKDQVNFCDKNCLNQTPLHAAAIKGDLDLVQFLLWAHADPNTADADEKTPLHYAKLSRERGHVDAAELLQSQETARKGLSPSPTKVTNTTARPLSTVEVAFNLDNDNDDDDDIGPLPDDYLHIGGLSSSSSSSSKPKGDVTNDLFYVAQQIDPQTTTTTHTDKTTTHNKTTIPHDETNGNGIHTHDEHPPPISTTTTASTSTTMATTMATPEMTTMMMDIRSPTPPQPPPPTVKSITTADALLLREENSTIEDRYDAMHIDDDDDNNDEDDNDLSTEPKPIGIQSTTTPATTTIPPTPTTTRTIPPATTPIPPTPPPPTTQIPDVVTYTITTNEEVKAKLKAKLKKDRTKLWEPPYTGANDASTITPDVLEKYCTAIDADPSLIASVLEKIRVSSVSRKLKKETSKETSKDSGKDSSKDSSKDSGKETSNKAAMVLTLETTPETSIIKEDTEC